MESHILRLGHFTETMHEATVVEWLVKVGELVSSGDPVVVIETDKATTEIPAPMDGVILEINSKPGDVVKVGQGIALIGPVGGATFEKMLAGPPVAGSEAGAGLKRDSDALPSLSSSFPQGASSRIRISPLAQRIAREKTVDMSRIQGSGVYGTIVKEDVLRFIEKAAKCEVAKPASQETAAEYQVITLSGMRRTIAERMSLSRRTTADVTTIAEVEISALNKLREVIPASYTAFVVKASAEALRDFPILNAALKGDDIHLYQRVHISVAVALEDGLVTPVVYEADKKTVLEIAAEIERLSEKASQRRLSRSELEGGTFTVTNSGVFGSLLFTPIINYPQAATLGMGKVFKTPVVDDQDRIIVGRVMHLCLSYDHRIIDGKPAVQFLQAVKRSLEHPDPAVMMTGAGSPERAFLHKKAKD